MPATNPQPGPQLILCRPKVTVMSGPTPDKTQHQLQLINQVWTNFQSSFFKTNSRIVKKGLVKVGLKSRLKLVFEEMRRIQLEDCVSLNYISRGTGTILFRDTT